MSTPDQLFLAFQEAIAGRYSIDREIGRGGMGIVYLAREVHLDRSVAIKLLPPERAADRTLRDRFLREARNAAKLSHPNIIPIHAVDETDGFVFYVMAFIDGETLANRVRTRGPLPNNEGARVLREVAWALAHAHERGLIHRDVKPDNILLESGSSRVLVADFGIAAAFSEASAEGIAGTPEFMSPEQALGTQLDARSDLYGLGATAFYAFSGRFPFEGKTATEVLAKQVTEPAPPLSTLGVAVPRKISALIDRCLAKSPDQRPDNAQALAEQLSVAMELRKELPVALRAFVKRNARIDGGGMVLGWLAIAGGAVGLSTFFGATAAWGLFALLATSTPFAYLSYAAARLMKQGFAQSDLDGAFQSEAERAREELMIDPREPYPRLEKLLALVSAGSWVIAIPAMGATMTALTIAADSLTARIPNLFGSARLLDSVAMLGFWTFAVAVFSSMGYLALRMRREDVDTVFWSRVWSSRLGQWAFKVAGKLLPASVRAHAMTHRATELSLGMAAEQLFETLPKETRLSLGDIPMILKRLQQDAQELRKRHESLNDALTEAGDAAVSPDYAEVREMRDTLHEKLGQTVGALETMRLNLLRLHAGTADVASVTTHLSIAAEVSEDVKRLIAAHGEVRQLNFPRTPATTPV